MAIWNNAIETSPLAQFANKSISILIATDVAARGLDVDNLDMVINYQLSRDPEVHVHRIGRTGRAGSKGMACNLFSKKEMYRVMLIDEFMDLPVEPVALPAMKCSHRHRTRRKCEP